MVKRRPLVLIAGWAHTEHALHPVASALHAAAYDIKVKSIWQLLDQMEKATRQGCGPNACRPAWGEDLARRGACKENPGLSCYADALKQTLQKQDDPCVVVGWSAGAIVALEVTCESPGSLKGLVLIGATPKFCAEEGYSWGVAARNVRAMIMQVRKEPRAVLGRFFQDVSWPAVESESCLNEKVNAACHIGIEHLVHGLEYLRKMDLRDRLKGIEIPILIIHGKKDRIVPWQAGAWLNRSLPNSRIIIHEGVGHDIPERQAVVLASQIREFLENRC
jgi:pimeloyl-[acyl-carrier protein] methyl ester esterase